MNTYWIRVAGVCVKLISDQPMVVSEAFEPFAQYGAPDYTACFVCADQLPKFALPPEQRLQSLDIFSCGDGVCVRFRTREDEPYAAAEFDWTQNTIRVTCLRHYRKIMDSVENGFVHILWELLMLYRHRLILHAACVQTDLGGILFSGASGIGKSTQARLWRETQNARLINGDRTVLHRDQGMWQAFGSPYAGSSRCYRNESCPVRAIVMLKQAPACSVRRLTGMEAFCSLYKGITASSWDKKSMALACDMTQTLAQEIPIYELSCTPTPAAVYLLRQTLETETF